MITISKSSINYTATTDILQLINQIKEAKEINLLYINIDQLQLYLPCSFE